MKIRELFENKERYAYHGGTYAGGEYEPWRRGEPGNIRPLGSGLYAAETPDHAHMYVKYAGDNGKVRKFRIADDAKLYPVGRTAWNACSAEEQEFWKSKSNEVQEAYKNSGVPGSERRYWQDELAMNSNRDFIRKLLVSMGVDGARQDLNNGMVELVFYHTGVLEPVSDYEYSRETNQ